MHLSKEIQGRLEKLDSGLRLSSTIDGMFPDKYSFHKGTGRSFRTELAASDNRFSLILFERTDKQKHENCFARGLFNNLDRLTQTIKLWTDDQRDIKEIKSDFDELELYRNFDFEHQNPDIETAWDKVKEYVL